MVGEEPNYGRSPKQPQAFGTAVDLYSKCDRRKYSLYSFLVRRSFELKIQPIHLSLKMRRVGAAKSLGQTVVFLHKNVTAAAVNLSWLILQPDVAMH